jgi:hypothetical protein
MARDIDIVIERVRSRLPAVVVGQLEVSHPGIDDDGLWFFRLPVEKKEVQLESSTGAAPFIVEHSSAAAIHGVSIDEAAAEVVAYLTKKETSQTSQPMRSARG